MFALFETPYLMIVNVQCRKCRRLAIVHKPYYGCFYSQYTHDTIGGRLPPKMSETELAQHVFFGNFPAMSPVKSEKFLVELNSERYVERNED